MDKNLDLRQPDIGPGDGSNRSTIRKPGILHVSLLYSLCVLLLTFVGSRVQRTEFYSGILITEFILILLPALLMLFIFRYDVKKVLRLNKIDFANIGLLLELWFVPFLLWEF